MKKNKFLFFAVMSFYVLAGAGACTFLFLKGSSLTVSPAPTAAAAAPYDIKPELTSQENPEPSTENPESAADVPESAAETQPPSNEAETSETDPTAQEPGQPESETPVFYAFTVIPVTSLNVRLSPNTQAKRSFYLRSGDTGIVLEKGDKWSLIKSAKGIGYVFNQYLEFREIPQEEYEAGR